MNVFQYYQPPSLDIKADILHVLKVLEEPLGESNAERRVKILNNIFTGFYDEGNGNSEDTN